MRSLHSRRSVLSISKLYVSSGICSAYISMQLFFFFDKFFPVRIVSGLVKSLPIHIQSTTQQNISRTFMQNFGAPSMHSSLLLVILPGKFQPAQQQWSLSPCLPSTARPLCTVWLPSLLSLCCSLESESMQKTRGIKWLSSCAYIFLGIEFLHIYVGFFVLFLFLSAFFSHGTKLNLQTNYVEILKYFCKQLFWNLLKQFQFQISQSEHFKINC